MINPEIIKIIPREECEKLLPWDFEFNIIPYTHQLQSLIWAVERDNIALFLEMGTGKSMTSINWAKFLHLKKILIVTVNFPLAYNWLNEFRINYPELKGAVLEGDKKDRIRILNQNLDFYIINYEGLKVIFEELQSIAWEAMICDESRRIKSIQAIRTQLCIELGKTIPYKAILSGIPTVHPLDIFPQYLFLDRGKIFGSNFYKCRAKYFDDEAKINQIKHLLSSYEDIKICKLLKVPLKFVMKIREQEGIRYNPYAKKAFIPRAHLRIQKWVLKKDMESEFLELINKNCIRYNKKECLDLPDKIYQNLYINLSERQMEDYYKLWRKEGDLSLTELTPREIENCLMKYSQITGGFIKHNEDYIYYEENPKLEILMDMVNDAIDETKITIFHRFIAEGRQIEERLKKEGIKYASLRGEVKDKTGEYEKFINDNGVRVMIAHPLSGGMGLNFIQSAVCIYYSLDYAIEYKLQSEDRLHRIGQNKNVTYYHLLAKRTIDEEIWKAHQEGIGLIERMNRYNLSLKDIIEEKGMNWKEEY